MTPDMDGFSGDTPVANRFLFEVDGVEIGVFTEVSGLELKVEVESYQEGGENSFVHKLPGRISWPHIVLKRGVTDSDALFSWVNKSAGDGFAANGNKLTRCTGAITTPDCPVLGLLREYNVSYVEIDNRLDAAGVVDAGTKDRKSVV